MWKATLKIIKKKRNVAFFGCFMYDHIGHFNRQYVVHTIKLLQSSQHNNGLLRPKSQEIFSQSHPRKTYVYPILHFILLILNCNSHGGSFPLQMTTSWDKYRRCSKSSNAVIIYYEIKDK